MFTKIIVVVLFGYVQIASSIRCYDCNSYNNSMCSDPTEYDEETLARFLTPIDCQQGVYAVAPEGNYHFFCRKITQKIHLKEQELERVTRGCGWVRHKKDCYSMNTKDHLETVCQCFTDGCNSAPHLKLGLWTVLGSLVVSIRRL